MATTTTLRLAQTAVKSPPIASRHAARALPDTVLCPVAEIGPVPMPPEGFIVQVDAEYEIVRSRSTDRDGNLVYHVERGAYGTTKATHAAAATVTIVVPAVISDLTPAAPTEEGGGGAGTLAEVLALGADADGVDITGLVNLTGAAGGDLTLSGAASGGELALGETTGAGGGPASLAGGEGGAGDPGGAASISAGSGDAGTDLGAAIVLHPGDGAGNDGAVAITGSELTFNGTGLQPVDPTLTAFAALAIAANKLPYGSGSDAFSLADLTAAGRALLDDADAAAQLTTLGVSAFAKTLLDDADAAAARTTLGVTAGTTLVAASITDSTTGTFNVTNAAFQPVHASFNLGLTTGAHRVKVTVAGGCSAVGALDLYVDGASVSGDKGLIINDSAAVAGDQNASFSFLTVVLSAGAHTFELRFKGTNFALYAGAGSGGPALHMAAEETPFVA